MLHARKKKMISFNCISILTLNAFSWNIILLLLQKHQLKDCFLMEVICFFKYDQIKSIKSLRTINFSQVWFFVQTDVQWQKSILKPVYYWNRICKWSNSTKKRIFNSFVFAIFFQKKKRTWYSSKSIFVKFGYK